MTTQELWKEMCQHEKSRSHFFSRALVLISHKDFEQYKNYFRFQKTSPFNNLENYRSCAAWRHIHAVKREDGVQIHLDSGNPTAHWLFNIPHTFFDVIPYFIWCALLLKKPYYF